jgi:hypothetical protein
MTCSGSACGYWMMGIIKQKFGNEHEMSINEFSNDSLFPGLFVAFTYNKKQPSVFGADLHFGALFFLSLAFRSVTFQITYLTTTY